jgi:hypothetical protein
MSARSHLSTRRRLRLELDAVRATIQRALSFDPPAIIPGTTQALHEADRTAYRLGYLLGLLGELEKQIGNVLNPNEPPQ